MWISWFCAAFFAKFWLGLKSPPSLSFPKAAFLLHIFLPYPIPFSGVCSAFYQQRAWRIAVLVCMGIPKSQGLALSLNAKDFLRPIVAVIICTTKALAALRRPLCAFFTIFFVGFGQIACTRLLSCLLTWPGFFPQLKGIFVLILAW